MNKSKETTSEVTVHSPEATPDLEATWSRLPKANEVEPRTGLNRHAINKLILGDSPLVVSRSLKSHPQAERSIRLVKIAGRGSLLEYLNREDA